MPKLWSETIEAHRREVRDAILDATATLVAEHGLLAVTMSQIAEETGIGRATLYKYFSGVDEILHAWHDRQVATHLAHLQEIRSREARASERLEAVLRALVEIQRRRRPHSSEPHGGELAAFLHGRDQLAPAKRELRAIVRDLLTDAVADGDIREDVSAAELTDFTLHALSAASGLSTKAASQRLVTVALDGLRPPHRCPR